MVDIKDLYRTALDSRAMADADDPTEGNEWRSGRVAEFTGVDGRARDSPSSTGRLNDYITSVSSLKGSAGPRTAQTDAGM